MNRELVYDLQRSYFTRAHIHTRITGLSPIMIRMIYQVCINHTHTVSDDCAKAFTFGETFRIWTSVLVMLYKHVACELH